MGSDLASREVRRGYVLGLAIAATLWAADQARRIYEMQLLVEARVQRLEQRIDAIEARKR